jgi:hypothetical protein
MICGGHVQASFPFYFSLFFLYFSRFLLSYSLFSPFPLPPRSVFPFDVLHSPDTLLRFPKVQKLAKMDESMPLKN